MFYEHYCVGCEEIDIPNTTPSSQFSYQAGLMVNPLYVINFFVSGIPMGFVITWVYDETVTKGLDQRVSLIGD